MGSNLSRAASASRAPRRGIVGSALYLVAYAGWVAAMMAGAVPRGPVNDLLFLPLYALPVITAWQASRADTVDPRSARGWYSVALAWALSLVGSLVWLLYRWWPSPLLDSTATVLYNLYYPCSIVALWHFIQWPRERMARARLMVESLIALVATVTLGWYFVLRFGAAVKGPADWLELLGVLFLGELAIVVGATMLMQRSASRGDALWPTWFGVGSFFATIADFMYKQGKLVSGSWTGPIADLLLAIGAVMIVIAALTFGEGGGRRKERLAPVLGLGLTALPFAAIALLGALVVIEFWRRTQLGPLAGLVSGGGALMALVIVRLMVSQREYAREARARANQDDRFRSLVLHSSDALLVLDAAGRIRYASPSFGRMAGVGDDDVVGREINSFTRTDSRVELSAALDPASTRPPLWRLRGSGAECVVEVVATDRSQDPAVRGIVLNLRDVTHRLRLEEQLRQSQKLEVAGRLATSVAHEFNNMVTVVLGNVQLAQFGQGGAATHELESIERAAERGATLVRQLLTLGRPVPANPVPLDLAAEVRRAERVLKSMLPASIAVSVRSLPLPVMVELDAVQLEQVLLNLAINARDAMPSGGHLVLEVSAQQLDDAHPERPDELNPGPWAVVRVTDTGAGMDAGTLARAFEPFFTTKSEGAGSGLGLATVRGMVSEAGGHIAIASMPGAGTTVSLYFPLLPAEDVSPPRPARIEPARGEGRLLVVEDELDVRTMLVEYLTALGYEVLQAGNGREGLHVLATATQPIDLVLTDMIMPKMGGREFVSRLRDRMPGLPVLCMSGTLGVPDDENEPWSAERLVLKPVSLDKLARRIAAALAVGARE
jgi:PAS domain S-box-containing protein